MANGFLERANPWRGLKGLPVEVWTLAAATLVNRAGTMVLPFLVLYLTRDRHLSPAVAGVVVALYGAGSLLVAPIAGRLCDRLSPIKIMRGSLFLSAGVMLLYPLARTLPAIVAATLLLAVTTESFRPANLAIIGNLVEPSRRKPAFALHRLAANLGMSIGPALGGFLATLAFRWLFLVDGATSLAAGAILLAFPFRERGRASDASAVEESISPLSHRPGSAFRDGRLLFFLFGGVLPVALVLFQHLSSMPLYLVRDVGLSAAAYGLLFTVNTLMIVFLEVPLNVSTAHWPHKRGLVLGAALFAIGFGALAFAWNLASAVATVVIWTVGEMFFFPGMAAYLTDIAPSQRRGEYMGLSQMVMGLAFMLGPWAGTAILETFGGRAVWGATFVCGLAAALLIARLEEPTHVAAAAALPTPTASPSAEP